MVSHEEYMGYCIQLAKRGAKATKTNPMVGSILVYKDQIIGEGYHEVYGQNHAERNAINNALEKNKSLVPKSTLYVTLEPCFHQGKTPPCVNYILENKIQKVVMGCLDPHPLVGGKSISLLKEKGIEVIQDVKKEECEYLISKFVANIKKRPYIILKWAQSQDGYMGKKNEQVWISNKYSKILVHKWRSEVEGIMVGTQTAITDNPSLTTREWTGDSPIRIIPDFKNRIPPNSKIYTDGNKTIVLGNKVAGIQSDNVEYLSFNEAKIEDYWSALFEKEIYSIMIEGGKKLLSDIIKSGLWDEARVITSSHSLNEGLRAPSITGKLHSEKLISDDKIVRILNEGS